MPFDGELQKWEPDEPDWPWRGCYVVIPHFGPRGGQGPYRGRWTVETTSPSGWIAIASLIAPNRRVATGIAGGIMRRAAWCY